MARKGQSGQLGHENIDICAAIAKQFAELDGAQPRRAAEGVIADESLRNAESRRDLRRGHQTVVAMILFRRGDSRRWNSLARFLNSRRHNLEPGTLFGANGAFLSPRLAAPCAVFFLRRLGLVALIRRLKQIGKEFVRIVTSERNGRHGSPRTPTCPQPAARLIGCPIALIDRLIDFVYQSRSADWKTQGNLLKMAKIFCVERDVMSAQGLTRNRHSLKKGRRPGMGSLCSASRNLTQSRLKGSYPARQVSDMAT